MIRLIHPVFSQIRGCTYVLGSLFITSIAAGSEVISLCSIGAAGPLGARFESIYVIYGAAVVWDRKYKNWSPEK
jgi:hypothetical protein